METIVAIATPSGEGAIGIIRLSGSRAIDIANALFKGKNLQEAASHTLHFGRIVDTSNTDAEPEVIDEVVLSIFKNPRSYTGEDVVEISCHGSAYILQRILALCVDNGAKLAAAGEFTQRAFLNGRLDLTQAEAVADLIATEHAAAHKSAMHNLRGGFSAELKDMREQLITFSALIELELDFSQEDVEFADRSQLYALLDEIGGMANRLIDSFAMGNAVKNGVSVAILGAPNAGKSTLLNSLLNEDRAIVSDIAGTTRDSIEEALIIHGMKFRLIDTAGIRESAGDTIEDIGIARSLANAEKADFILHVVDVSKEAAEQPEWLLPYSGKTIELRNKYDLLHDQWKDQQSSGMDSSAGHFINAKTKEDAHKVKEWLYAKVASDKVKPGNTIITNTRHLEALKQVSRAISDIRSGLDQDISGELVALDIRQALHYIGEITGAVQIDRDVLGAVFGKFCIGK